MSTSEYEVILADGDKAIEFKISPEVIYKSVCENDVIPLSHNGKVIGNITEFKMEDQRVTGVATIDKENTVVIESLVMKTLCSISINGYFRVEQADLLMTDEIKKKSWDIEYKEEE